MHQRSINMKEKHIKALIKDFPNLYRNARKSSSESCMHWGFTCGDGWFDILYQMSAQIEARALQHGLDCESDEWPAARQIKEKFGGLRCSFFHGEGMDISDLVDAATEKANGTCERCGEPGEIRDGGWMVNLCDKCLENREEMRNKEREDYDLQESIGGWRKVYDDVFAEVDAEEDARITAVCNATKRVYLQTKKSTRTSAIDDLRKKGLIK
jgi:hypothetical protein